MTPEQFMSQRIEKDKNAGFKIYYQPSGHGAERDGKTECPH
jgi:hypothetical protein